MSAPLTGYLHVKGVRGGHEADVAIARGSVSGRATRRERGEWEGGTDVRRVGEGRTTREGCRGGAEQADDGRGAGGMGHQITNTTIIIIFISSLTRAVA